MDKKKGNKWLVFLQMRRHERPPVNPGIRSKRFIISYPIWRNETRMKMRLDATSVNHP